MSHVVEYVANVYDKKTKKLIATKKLFKKDVVFPESIDELGIRHAEQIELIRECQNVFLEDQCLLFSDREKCPECGGKLRKQGRFKSDFHDVFTDHVVNIQRHTCLSRFLI